MASVDDILQNVNQPVIDDLISLIVSGKSRLAYEKLIELEGHWISEQDAINFIVKVKQVYGCSDSIILQVL